MKIGVMGTGGVGGYFGGLLARAGCDIHFVARGKHLQTIAEEGLQVVSNQGSFRALVHATSEPHEIGPVNLLLFCVKSYDTLDASRIVEPMVEDDTVILTLQNGIDNSEKLLRRYGDNQVMDGTTFIESSIASPGVIAHSGKPGRIVFGERSHRRTERSEDILGVLKNGGIDATLSSSIKEELWLKFLFICGVHGVSTVARASLGLVLSCPETRELLTGVMWEVEKLAKYQGVNLPGNAVSDSLALAQTYSKEFKCSMLRDLEWRKPLEIDALNGMVVELGKAAGIETPLNQAIYACLQLENQKILNPLWSHQINDHDML